MLHPSRLFRFFVALTLLFLSITHAHTLSEVMRERGPTSDVQEDLARLLLGSGQAGASPRAWLTERVLAARSYLRSAQLISSSPSSSYRDSKRENDSVDAHRLRDNHPHTEDILSDPMPGREFDFFPEYVTSIPYSGDQVEWSSPCFSRNLASLTSSSDGFELQIDVSEPSSVLCSDFYLLLTTEGFHLKTFAVHGKHSIDWKWSKKATEDDIGWVEDNGVRVFRFFHNEASTIENIAATTELFAGLVGGATLPSFVEEANSKFLEAYVGYDMPKRSIKKVVLNESLIHSGDVLLVMRLDGLDPMEAWGMGSHSGHVTMALWIEGKLYVVESTSKTNYWPKDFIQRTPYDEWLELAERASYNVILLPLSPEKRAQFNETRVVEWFVNDIEGLSYGFANYLACWIDTNKDNFPPPLSWELLEPLFALVGKMEPSLAHLMWEQMLCHRLGCQNLTTVQIYTAMRSQGLTFPEVITMPEQDSWIYDFPTSRSGPSYVCDVFVCECYKQGGLFGSLADSIQCTEFNNWDLYSLNFFDTNFVRPPQCVEADPDSEFCQLLGAYRMNLPDYNTKTPYSHMAERCPSLPPKYIRPPRC